MTPKAKEYADRIRDRFLLGDDSGVASVLEELNEDQDLYLEVWGCFPASMRRQLKDIEAYYRDHG